MRAKDLGRLCFVLSLLALAPPSLHADAVPGKSLKQALQRYKDALAKIRWTARDGTIEGLYERAVDFGLDTDPALPAEMRDFLATASPVQLAAFKEDLEGLVVTPDPLTVAPDLAWFLARARKSEADESADFFVLLMRVRPPGGQPAFLGPNGCVAFGGGTIVDLYRRLRKGSDEWPHYRRLAAAEAARLFDVLTTATCACGDAAGVERELRQLLKTPLKDADASKVTARLEALRAGTSGTRFQCGTP